MTKGFLLRPSDTSNFALLMIASLLYLLNFTTGSDIISLFLTLLLVLYVFGATRANLLPTMIYLSFFTGVMVYGGIYLSFFVVLAFFLRVTLDGAFRAKDLLFYFTIYFVIHFISTGLGNLSVARMGEVLSFFLVLPAGYAFSKCKSKDCIIYFITGFFVSTIFGYARKYLPRLDKVAGDTDVTLLENMAETYRFSGISNDSNFYAILAIAVLFVLLFKIRMSYQAQKSNGDFIIVALVFVTFALGLVTYSKSYVLCAFFLFAIYFIRVKKLSLVYSIAVVFISLIAFYFFSSSISAIESAYMLRFGDDRTDLDMITSNRTVIWADYMKEMSNFSFSQMFFGNGMNLNGKVAAHNTFIQLLYEFGIIGFITNLILLYKSKKVFVSKKLAKNSFVIMALMVVLFFNLSGYSFSSAWAVFTIMFVCCSNNDVMV